MSKEHHDIDVWHIGELPGDNGHMIRDENGLKVLCCSSREVALEFVVRHNEGEAAGDLVVALMRAEAFIRGFEKDELQEGVDELLTQMRTVIARARGA